MTVRLLNQGFYELPEASILIGEPAERVARWARPSSSGLAALVPPSFERAFSFVDLVSLRLVAELKRRGVADADLRRGVAVLRKHFEVDQPLAHRRVLDLLATSGSALLADLGDGWVDIGKGRQGVFETVVDLYLRHIHFGSNGLPERWQPADRVVLDPRVQAGSPCVVGTRVPTATIADLLASADAEDVALDFALDVADVLAAAEFERQLAQGSGLAA
jgi:uncharacterized protein (DUF433 family)